MVIHAVDVKRPVGVDPQVFMRQHHAFGHAGGAAGVDDDCDIVVIALYYWQINRGLGIATRQGVNVNNRDVAGVGSDFFHQAFFDNHQRRVAVPQDKAHLQVAQGLADRHCDDAQVPAGIEEVKMLKALRRDKCNPLTFADFAILEKLAPGEHVSV